MYPNKIYALTLILILFFSIPKIFSQNTLNSTGVDIETDAGSIYYSIGQTGYILSKGSSGSAAQGVQQPLNVISFVDGVNYTAYPNPTDNIINLVINSGGSANDLYYSLSDTHGRILLSNIRITDYITSISVEKLPAAVYFVRIYNLLKTYQTLKIIKI